VFQQKQIKQSRGAQPFGPRAVAYNF